MRALIVMLALASSALALNVPSKVYEREVIIKENDRVIVTYKPGCFLLVDPMDQSLELSLNEQVTRGEKEWTWQFWGPSGSYRIRELDPSTFAIAEAYCQIERGEEPPEPEPEPEPQPEPPQPEPFPDTKYDIGPQVARPARELRDAGKVTNDDLRRLAVLVREVQHGLEQDKYPTLQDAMDDLSAKVNAFEPDITPIREAYRKTMDANWTAGKVRTMDEHAGALKEVADWLVGEEKAAKIYLEPHPLGKPRIVGKRCFGGTCYPVDQYGNIYWEGGAPQ